MADGSGSKLDDFARRLDDLSQAMERASLAEYVELVRRPWRMAYVNFIAGLARGVGTAIGFTVLGAFLIYLLQHYVARNLPWLASRIADLIEVTDIYLKAR